MMKIALTKHIRLAMLCLTLCTLTARPAYAETFSVTVATNTPLFEESGCHIYEGKEAVRAIMHIILSARIHLDIEARTYESPTINSLLWKKAAAGVSLTVYSPAGYFPQALATTPNMRLVATGSDGTIGELVVRSDNLSVVT